MVSHLPNGGGFVADAAADEAVDRQAELHPTQTHTKEQD
jgi:hypothetical protein